VAQLRDWHARAYAPERMVVAVVGDVDPAEGVALVEGAFGDLGAGGAWPDPPATDATPRARRVNLARPVNQSVLVLGCPGPAQASPDRYALDVLMSILSGMGTASSPSCATDATFVCTGGAFGSSLRAGGAGAHRHPAGE
jgi:zinc protease